MKKIVLIFLFLIGAYTLEAQELTWHTNLNEAIQLSEQTKKPLLLFFTGSDWCGWCIRLQNEVLRKPEFAAWAKDHVVLVEVDFPRRKQLPPETQKQNGELQQFFGVHAYPTVWFVNANKKDDKIIFSKLGSTGYLEGGPSAWLNAANQIIKQK
ncbi:MAG TPA: thioredoxin family protein [Bacteroidia bacterium]|nr:thioredoxin family protein [Bacteroidia bacterium]